MEITLTAPDDWHVHLRDGEVLAASIAPSAAQFSRALVMPNLAPPVTTTAQALAYRERIRAARPSGSGFEPLMSLYLTDTTPADEIERARASGIILAAKLYPAGATTHSEAGVTEIRRIEAVLARMEAVGLVLAVHGEVTAPEVDVFDREAVFITQVLQPLSQQFPRLKIVFEHVSTTEGIAFVQSARPGIAATLTAHHLLLNRNALFQGGLRPHHYCLPVIKRETHRQALLAAATSGNPRFFLGTDSAPHPRHAKESACGCAGLFTAPIAMALYAEAFEAAGALSQLEGFASFYGADFYGVPRNTHQVQLRKQTVSVPTHFAYGAAEVVPLRAGQTVAWGLVDALV